MNTPTDMNKKTPKNLANKMALELATLTLERLKVPVTQESIGTFIESTELVDVMESRLAMLDALHDCEDYIVNSKARLDFLEHITTQWAMCAKKFFDAATIRGSYEQPDFATVEALKLYSSLKAASKKA